MTVEQKDLSVSLSRLHIRELLGDTKKLSGLLLARVGEPDLPWGLSACIHAQHFTLEQGDLLTYLLLDTSTAHLAFLSLFPEVRVAGKWWICCYALT